MKFRLLRKSSKAMFLTGFTLLIEGTANSVIAADCTEQANVIHSAGFAAVGGGIPMGMSAIILLALGFVYLGSNLAGIKHHKNDNPKDRCSEFK